jgi:mRNA interferase MazF
MNRGELYLVRKPMAGDPKRQRVFVTVSRQALMRANFSTVICAPVYSRYHGLESQVSIGADERLKHQSSYSLRPTGQPAAGDSYALRRAAQRNQTARPARALLVALDLDESEQLLHRAPALAPPIHRARDSA